MTTIVDELTDKKMPVPPPQSHECFTASHTPSGKIKKYLALQ